MINEIKLALYKVVGITGLNNVRGIDISKTETRNDKSNSNSFNWFLNKMYD